jgi:hypothetical protein
VDSGVRGCLSSAGSRLFKSDAAVVGPGHLPAEGVALLDVSKFDTVDFLGITSFTTVWEAPAEGPLKGFSTKSEPPAEGEHPHCQERATLVSKETYTSVKRDRICAVQSDVHLFMSIKPLPVAQPEGCNTGNT